MNGKFVTLIKKRAREDFRRRIIEGDKMSLAQLRRLNTIEKDDYIGIMLEEDE